MVRFARLGVLTFTAVAVAMAGFAGSAHAQLPPDAVAAIEQIVSKPVYANSTWGIQVQDLETGEVLYSSNADLMFVPGSIMKNFSTAAALAAEGPDFRYRTPVFKQGTVDGKELDGDLVLVASGDTSFGLRDQSDDTLAFTNFDHNEANNIPGVTLVDGDPLAGVNQLARDVKRSGIDRVSGDVVIDDRLWKTYEGPGADGPVPPIWVNENVIDIQIEPGEPGQPATVEWRPHVPPYSLDAQVDTGDAGSDTDVQIDEGPDGAITVSGTIAADAGTLVRDVKVEDPAAFARSAFIQALERAGVEVDASVTGANPKKLLPDSRDYPAADRVARRVSPPLSEYVKVILKVSYNRGADSMVCLVAVHAGSRDCADGIAPEVATIQDLGVPENEAFVFDGAGSDDYNRVTPAAMNAFLRGVSEQPYGSVFRNGYPVLGVDGSLATTLPDSPAAGKVQAKTGTRGTTTPDDRTVLLAQTLTAYITAASGRELVASAFVNNMPIADVTEILDVFADEGQIMATVQQSM
jgi:D-alanyl-D-alanine carboxypeptidase/D-alanyl-D-alanine-endopeptidase (penicillin-binding protein 4)